MPPTHAALVPDGSPRKRYRLSPDAKLTRAQADEGAARHGFYKDAKSGRLFRLGPEEFFLLTQLERGRDFGEAAKAFRARFGTGVRETTIAGFAAQMVAAGVLIEAPEDEEAAAIPEGTPRGAGGAEKPASDPAAPLAQGVVPADELDALEDILPPETSAFDGPGDDDIEGLEELIFSGSASDGAPRDPEPAPPTPSKASFRAAAEAARTALEAARETAGQPKPTGPDDVDSVQRAPEGKTEPPLPKDEPAASSEDIAAQDHAAAKAPPPESAASTDKADEPAESAASAKPRSQPFFRKTGLHDGVSRKPAPKEETPGGQNPEPDQGSEDPKPTRDPAPGARANKSVAARKMTFERNGDLKSEAPSNGIMKVFTPNGLYAVLNAVFGWLAWFKWLLWPLTLFAFMAVFTRLSEYGTSISNARGAIDLFWRLAISMVTVNFCTAFFTGWAIHRQGGKVPAFGVRMIFFVIPRFAIDESGVYKLPREGKLAVYSTTMRTRLFLFAAGTVFWAFTRHSQTVIPDMMLLVSQIALFTLVVTAFPLMSGDGYKYLTTFFRQDMLKQRAHAWLFKNNQSKMGFTFPDPSPGEKRVFLFYTIGSMLFLGLVLTFLFVWGSTALVGRYGGSGAAIFFALLAGIGFWVLSMKAKQEKAVEHGVKTAMAEKMAERGGSGAAGFAGGGAGFGAGGAGGGFAGGDGAAGFARPRGAGAFGGGAAMAGGSGAQGFGSPSQSRAMVPVPQTGRALALGQSRELTKLGSRPLPGMYAENTSKSRRSKWISRFAMLAVVGALLYAAFQPYAFEVGGDFTILPDTRIEVGARVAGELVEIYMDEGDVVSEGDLLARMSDWEPRLEVEVRIAKLAQAEARLQDLLDGASVEEIAIAEENVARAEAELPFLRSQAERAEELFSRTAISQVEYERYRLEYETGQIDLRSAEAVLADVTAPPSAPDVAVAEAEIERLNAELGFYRDQLDKVELRATADGRIVTENVQLLRGKYLQVGELFVEIEDHEIARAAVLVSETDIGLVQVNDRVRLKAWAIPDEERIGTVVSIAPSAESEEFGRVVRVKTQFPNEQGFFRPEMTGFAKIEGADMKTWEAFSRLIVRFFQIEVWGWIP